MVHPLRLTAAAAFGFLPLFGCHAGSSSAPPLLDPQLVTRAAGMRTASFTVVVDPPAPGVMTPQSVVVTLLQVNGVAPFPRPAAYTMNLGPATPACTPLRRGALSCTAIVPAPAGNIRFALTTYAGLNGTRTQIATSQVNALVTASGTRPCPTAKTAKSAPAKSSV